MMSSTGRRILMCLIMIVSLSVGLSIWGPPGVVQGSEGIAPSQLVLTQAAGKDQPVSASKLYEAISGYLDGLHGKGLQDATEFSGTKKGQRRDLSAMRLLEGGDRDTRQLLERDRALARSRMKRQEWDLALQTLERAKREASRMASAEDLEIVQDLQKLIRTKLKEVSQDGRPSKDEIINSIGMRLVVIPGGTFTMGSSSAEIRRIRNEWNVEEEIVTRESPAHRVQVSKPFLIGKYDVTVGQFKTFVNETGYQSVAETQDATWAYDHTKKHWIKKPGVSWRNPGTEVGDDHPVTMVCHIDAEAFCAWLSKRDGRKYELPTEAQWEYAARGGKEAQRFPWGDEYPDGRKLNLADRRSPVPWADRTVDDHYSGPSPVGCFDPNGFRLYDMAGNVWQLCADYFDPKAYQGTASGVAIDPKGPRTGKKKSVRGGNWAFGAGIARNAFRFGIEPNLCTDLSGFRVAAVAHPDDDTNQLKGQPSSYGKLTDLSQAEALADRVKKLVSGGRRLEARRLVDQSGQAGQKIAVDDPDGLVTEVLATLIDLSEDSSAQTFNNSLGIKMVRIPAGAFVMGSSEADIAWAMTTLAQNQPVSLENEFPFHKVRISRPFFMSATEVTVGQFQAFVEATGYITDAEDAGGGQVFNTKSNRWEQKDGSSWKSPGWTITPDQPVTMVSWNDAQAFVEWITAKEKLLYRLPTEAQWEYAARGGLLMTQFPWGDAVPDGLRANYADKNTDFEWRDRDADDGYKHVAPVGSFAANGYGLHDMAGNVIEWVRDYYGEDYYRFTPEVDSEGPGHGENRVTKGGDWSSGAASLRCAFRGWSRPDLAFSNTGFRVIVDTDSPQRMFYFDNNFLTKEWVPGPDQRAVTEAIAKEQDRRIKPLPSQSSPGAKTSVSEAPAIKGVQVLDLTPKSDAKKVGLAKGDIVVEYNGFRNLTSERLLTLTAQTKNEKTKPILIFIRDGYEYSVRVAPGYLGIAVMDTAVRAPFKKWEPLPEPVPRDEKNKKSKSPQWT